MKGFVGETLGKLDSSCTKNVCGNIWMKCYLETLSKEYVHALETTKGSTLFKFGNGERVKSKKFMKIPSIIAGKKVFIETDVVDCEIPLLLSKDAMKKAEF